MNEGSSIECQSALVGTQHLFTVGYGDVTKITLHGSGSTPILEVEKKNGVRKLYIGMPMEITLKNE